MALWYMSRKPSQPSHPSQSKELTEKQRFDLDEWNEKKKTGAAHHELIDMLKNSSLSIHPEAKFSNLINNIMPKAKFTNEKLSEDELQEYSKAILDYGIDNGSSVYELVGDKYIGMAIVMRRELIKEYECKNYSEKALVDLIVNAYCRNLMYSKKLLGQKDSEYLSHDRNGFMSVLSKEIDRANRHYIAALETLKQLKQPSLKVSISANNAFLANNQQVNGQHGTN